MTRLMTGARPTGGLHVGQYFAAFKPFVTRRDEFDEAFFVVSDLHMLTTKFTPDSVRGLPTAIRRLTAEAMAFGIDPARTVYYLQSEVQWQARIHVLLQSLADKAQLEAHGSYEEMARHSTHVRPPTLGLLGYPILESSDVLSIGATHVTVGEHNLSHFQQLYGILDELRDSWGIEFTRPEVIIGRANLVGTDGSDKMSKSLGNAVFFADSPDVITAKIRAMAVHGDGLLVPIEYLRVLGAPEELCTELAEEITAADRLTERAEKELTDRMIALVEPVDVKARALIASGAVDDSLRHGHAIADELGRAAYQKLVDGLGLLRLNTPAQVS